MINKNEIEEKINSEEDFIYCPRMNNSLKVFINSHPDGVDNTRIAKVLLIKEEEVEEIYQSAIKKFQENLKKEIKNE